MKHYISSLRNKPEQHRRHIALGVSFAVTAIIFTVWLTVFVSNLQGSGKQAVKKENTPISAIKENFASAIGALWKDSATKTGTLEIVPSAPAHVPSIEY